MVTGQWSVVSGQWSAVSGQWSVVTSGHRSPVSHWFLATSLMEQELNRLKSADSAVEFVLAAPDNSRCVTRNIF